MLDSAMLHFCVMKIYSQNWHNIAYVTMLRFYASSMLSNWMRSCQSKGASNALVRCLYVSRSMR
jgi:hypothetical protein